MNRKQIKLCGIQDAIRLVSAAQSCDFDVDIGYNRIIVDGKSILGVCSMDLNHPLTVTYQGNSPTFEQFLSKYELRHK